MASALAATEYEDKTLAMGMWVFLISELMLFSGIIFAFLAYRFLYPVTFAAAGARLKIILGSINTAVLLSSSASMAVAVSSSNEATRRRKTIVCLLVTLLLGVSFLGIKGTEYVLEYRESLFPWRTFVWEGSGSAQAKLFFLFYFLLTGLHALHMLLGLTAITVLTVLTGVRDKPLRQTTQILGLYWHFVDMVWVFLFPLLYLNGRT